VWHPAELVNIHGDTGSGMDLLKTACNGGGQPTVPVTQES
jgi:hypothetical protein